MVVAQLFVVVCCVAVPFSVRALRGSGTVVCCVAVPLSYRALRGSGTIVFCCWLRCAAVPLSVPALHVRRSFVVDIA